MIEETRVAGGLVGLAVSDALGVPVEGVSRRQLRDNPVTGMRGYGVHQQPPGTWSDDSSLAFCTAEGLLPQFSPADMGGRFLRWVREGHWTPHGQAFGIGGTTRRALQNLAAGVPAEEAGPTGEESNGNGSLMRILPVALRFAAAEPPLLLEQAHRVSRLTHGHPRSQMACGIYVAVARRLLMGEAIPEAYRGGVEEASAFYAAEPFQRQRPHFARVLEGCLPALSERDVQSDGYVVHTLEAALWCLLTSSGFGETVLKAVNLGDDADTTGAVAGGLAGIAYGFEAIPADWVSALARSSNIRDLARRLWRAVADG